jgi:hypothetical protein
VSNQLVQGEREARELLGFCASALEPAAARKAHFTAVITEVQALEQRRLKALNQLADDCFAAFEPAWCKRFAEARLLHKDAVTALRVLGALDGGQS